MTAKTGAPVASTDQAVMADDGVLQLHGTVMPHGRRTHVWFEYGQTSELGGATAVQRLAAGYTQVALSDLVAAPSTGSVIYYRVVAENSAGMVTGAIESLALAPSGVFVSPGGSDAADGSFDHPWRTPARAAATAAAGTTIWLRAGTYPGFAVTRSGADGAPITFASYPGETAVIDGGSGGTNTVDLKGAHSITLDGLVVQGSVGQYHAGVMVEGGSSDVRILDSVIRDNHSYGVRVYQSVRVEVRGNTITGNDSGVRFDYTGDGSVVAANAIVNNTGMVVNDSTPGNDTGANGVVFYKSTGAIEVTGNTISGNRAPSIDYGYDGGAIEIFGASNITIDHNTMFDNQNVVETGTNSGVPCDHNAFLHNVAYGGNDKSKVSPRGPLANGLILRCASDMLIADNTLDDLDYWDYDINVSGGFAGGVDGLRIVNNVHTQRGDKIYAVGMTLPASVVIDSNTDLTAGPVYASVAGFGNVAGLAQFRTWTGRQLNGRFADPLYADRAGRDYRLLAGSPAIDAGQVVLGVTDGYRGTAPDAGFAEAG